MKESPKVYIVMGFYSEDSWVEKVFYDKSEAEAFADNPNGVYYVTGPHEVK